MGTRSCGSDTRQASKRVTQRGAASVAPKALKRAGFRDEAKEMQSRVVKAGSYNEALQIIMRYVNPVKG